MLIQGTEKEEDEMNFVLDLSELRVTKCINNIHPDTLWISLIREGDSADDTYLGNIIFHLIHIIYPSGSSGVHRLGLPDVGLY